MLREHKENQKVHIHYRVPADRLKEIKSIIDVLGGIEESNDKNDWEPISCDEAFPERHPGISLRGLRAREGLTQKALAERIGIEQSHVSNMEKGHRPISKAMAKKLGKIFDLAYKVFL